MQFRVLGPLEVHSRGEVHRLGSAKQRMLLAALLIEPGKTVTTDRLIALLWGETPPASARNSLQTYVARIRAELTRWRAAGRLTTHGSGYAMEVNPQEVDSLCFEHLLARARKADEPWQAAAASGDALALWRGPAFADLADSGTGRGASLRLDELWLEAFQLKIDALLELGRYTEAVADLEAAVQEFPLQEQLHEQLVRALASVGRTAEALEHAYRFRRRLADETGLDPSPRLATLEQDVRQQVPGALPEPDAPPRVAAGNPLPQPATTFIGRDDERRQLTAALKQARLVTVTGPGGVGKTRLALEVAAAHGDDRLTMDSRLCELGAVGEHAAVPHAVAAAVGLSTPPGPSFDEATVTAALRGRELLLVLDGCEHLVDAVASLAEAILRHCPQILLLATGRERIGVDGERVLPIAPLALPPPGAGDASGAPAVRLFVDRARAVRPEFDLSGDNADAVAEVCRRLDGLPLAIELAAARANALEPSDLAARLDERFVLMEAGRRAREPRHRTLRAVVDWSYQLLDDAERRTFTRASVFVGGFTLPLAEQVVADGRIPQGRVAALVSSLVDKSMIIAVPGSRPPRYTLLETLRAYGQERLAERGEADPVGMAHARAMVDLAERASGGLQTADEADWVARLDTEVDNLRAAHRWALQANEADLALRLSAALHRYGYWRLHREVLEWAEAAVGIATAEGRPALPGALAAAGVAAWMRGDLGAAEAYAQRGLAAADADEPDVSALLHEVAGDVATFRGHMEAAAPWFSAAVGLAERAGDEQTAVFNIGSEALVRAYGGQKQAAVALATAARDRASGAANPSVLAWTDYVCGEVVGTDDAPRALGLLEEARRIAESVRNEFVVGVVDVAAASVRSRLGDPGDALHNFLALIERWRRSNNWTQQWVTLRNLAESMVRLEEDEAATVLQAAAAAAGAAAPSHGAEAARLREAAATAYRRLGPEAYRAADERGRRLAAEDVLRLAVETIERLLTERSSTARS